MMALGLAGPAAAQAPDVEQELAAALPELSVDPSFDPSTSGGVPAVVEPVAPVEPVTPGSTPAPAAGGAQAPPAEAPVQDAVGAADVVPPPVEPVAEPAPPVEPVAEPAPPGPTEPAATVEDTAGAPEGGAQLPVEGLVAPYQAPTYLNLDIRILSPGDNGGVNQSGGGGQSGGVDRSGGAPGLTGGTDNGARLPENWTWNWNWGDCGAGAGPSTAGWNWNWNWGCQDLGAELPGAEDGRMRNVLDWAADPLAAPPMEIPAPGSSEFGSLTGFDGADEARGVTVGNGGAPSAHQRLEGGSPGGAAPAPAAQFALAAPASPMAAALVAAPSAPPRRAADPSPAHDRVSQDGGGGLDPFPFPAPLAAQTAAGSGGGGGGGGGALLLLAALIGGLALVPPPPGGRVHAWQRRLRSLLSSSRLERPG